MAKVKKNRIKKESLARVTKRQRLRAENTLNDKKFQQDIADYLKEFPTPRSDKEAFAQFEDRASWKRRLETRVRIREKYHLSPTTLIPPFEIENGQKLLYFNAISFGTEGEGIRQGNRFLYDHIIVRIGKEATYQELNAALPEIWKLKEYVCGKPFFKPGKGTLSSNYPARHKRLKKVYKLCKEYFWRERDKGRPPARIIEEMLEPRGIIEEAGCGITKARSVRDIIYPRKKKRKR